MLQKLQDGLLFLLALLCGVFFLEKRKNNQLETELSNQKLKNSDDKLVNQEQQNNKIILQEQQKINSINKPTEIKDNVKDEEDYWNNKK